MSLRDIKRFYSLIYISFFSIFFFLFSGFSLLFGIICKWNTSGHEVFLLYVWEQKQVDSTEHTHGFLSLFPPTIPQFSILYNMYNILLLRITTTYRLTYILLTYVQDILSKKLCGNGFVFLSCNRRWCGVVVVVVVGVLVIMCTTYERLTPNGVPSSFRGTLHMLTHICAMWLYEMEIWKTTRMLSTVRPLNVNDQTM